MTTQTPYSFAYELAAQRQADFEAAARRNSLVRALKLGRREARRSDGADTARARIPQQRGGAARCAADVG